MEKENQVTLSKSVYIPSIEGSDIYNYMFRGREFELKYIGMIPSSLELQKLLNMKLVTFSKKTNEKKLLSDDVINIKFTQKVKDGLDVMEASKIKLIKLEKELLKLDDEENQVKAKKRRKKINEYKPKLESYIKLIKEEMESDDTKSKWESVKNGDLRNLLYKDGFTLTNIDKKTGEITEQVYTVYKRSSAKSRVGECLFIRKELHKQMIDWSRMNIPFDKQPDEVKTDYPSLLAYESLVGSSIESTVTIHTKNILLVDDVINKFSYPSNVVRINKKSGHLDSFNEESEIQNSLFDGEALLESSYFPEGKAMMLLRNHMFKASAINTNIQEYFKANCPDDINYDDWKIPNMLGELMYAKDVHMIITPSSLKALKFYNVFGFLPAAEVDMWEHWKQIVEDDQFLFGVCKNEKVSKHGENQQMSYQMVNSIPLDKDHMKEEMLKLAKFELDYIERLKNDNASFVEHIRKSANDMNSNAMFVSLYERNIDIVRTKLFRKFRTEEISNHVAFVKRGKIRMNGDYLVLFGNGLEFLAHAIGKLDVNKPTTTLKDNEVYTTRFGMGKELSVFRNPHTSPSNILVAKNTYVKAIEDYFNLSDNIVCVNAIKFPIQDILSSCDYDSDTALFIESSHLLKISKRAFKKYQVCKNEVKSEKIAYKICNEDMAKIDNELSKSQFLIGEVVNLGQWALSAYWDLLSEGGKEVELQNLLKKVDVMTILSCICIDLAKKMYAINIRSEIAQVRKITELKNEITVDVVVEDVKVGEIKKLVSKDKPLFFKYIIEQNEKKETKFAKYECPMDYLFEIMDEIEYAKPKKDLDMNLLLTRQEYRSADRKQESKVFEYVEEMYKNINKINSNSNIKDEEKYEAIDNVIKYYEHYLNKLTVKQDTMYSILLTVSENKKDGIVKKLMSILHKTQNETFIAGFKLKNVTK